MSKLNEMPLKNNTYLLGNTASQKLILSCLCAARSCELLLVNVMVVWAELEDDKMSMKYNKTKLYFKQIKKWT